MTPWTAAYQAPPSMGFLRQEYWSGVPFPSAGDLPDPRIEPASPALAGRFPGGGNGNQLQYSCLRNPIDRGAWWAIVYRVAESDMIEVT